MLHIMPNGLLELAYEPSTFPTYTSLPPPIFLVYSKASKANCGLFLPYILGGNDQTPDNL